uniref:Uncharacterized protein n=1 Tax=Arcella intermedia TaxID=1963864 RepID=A0A6B2LYI9_9EUKA
MVLLNLLFFSTGYQQLLYIHLSMLNVRVFCLNYFWHLHHRY